MRPIATQPTNIKISNVESNAATNFYCTMYIASLVDQAHLVCCMKFPSPSPPCLPEGHVMYAFQRESVFYLVLGFTRAPRAEFGETLRYVVVDRPDLLLNVCALTALVVLSANSKRSV